jgi:hypothetical protein
MSSYTLFVHHVLSIHHIYFLGARFGCRAYAQGLDYLGRTRRSLFGLSHHLVEGLHHQPTGRCVWRSLLLDARRPIIPAICCLDFIVSYNVCSPAELGTSWCLDSSYNYQQLSWGLLGAHLVCAKSRLLSWGLPWWSDCYVFASLQLSWCVIRLLHAIWIRVLVLGSTSVPW